MEGLKARAEAAQEGANLDQSMVSYSQGGDVKGRTSSLDRLLEMLAAENTKKV